MVVNGGAGGFAVGCPSGVVVIVVAIVNVVVIDVGGGVYSQLRKHFIGTSIRFEGLLWCYTMTSISPIIDITSSCSSK